MITLLNFNNRDIYHVDNGYSLDIQLNYFDLQPNIDIHCKNPDFTTVKLCNNNLQFVQHIHPTSGTNVAFRGCTQKPVWLLVI